MYKVNAITMSSAQQREGVIIEKIYKKNKKHGNIYKEKVVCSEDWKLPLFFMDRRHINEILEFEQALHPCWRSKDKLKTVGVALVLCLNIGVDPPQKNTSQHVSKQCWIDPKLYSANKGVEIIGKALRSQYERFQPRARYRFGFDPTLEEVKKICTSLRKCAKNDRVLFHYNGHGVPHPTPNGEIWAFDEKFTRYVPISLHDILSWISGPTIFVYDCNRAGGIIKCMEKFISLRQEEFMKISPLGKALPSISSIQNCIQLGASTENDNIPLVPGLPADLFTSCLTTPVKTALHWFVNEKNTLLQGITIDMIENIPGDEKDRHTLLGELNWIFIAITDTIAWMTFRHDLFSFQKYFREDLLLANIMRNYLLAERIMYSFGCRTVSSPEMPSTRDHSMWDAWDLVLDQCLFRLPEIIADQSKYVRCSFFSDHLKALRVWLTCDHSDEKPPDQLPILLQVLLNVDYRATALNLLNQVLMLGPWAIQAVLSAGFFPILIKLLQNFDPIMSPTMVSIWAKIIGLYDMCQIDLVNDGCQSYFIQVLEEENTPAETLTAAAFVLAKMINEYTDGQKACLEEHLVTICLSRLHGSKPILRQWLALCLGLMWLNNDIARGRGIRDSAPEKLSELLTDSLPEVRVAAVFALGHLIANDDVAAEPTVESHNHKIARILCSVFDGSPIVRKELVIAFNAFITFSEDTFTKTVAACHQRKVGVTNSLASIGTNSFSDAFNTRGSENSKLHCSCSQDSDCAYLKSHSAAIVHSPSIYHLVYECMLKLAEDADPDVAILSRKIVSTLNTKAFSTFSPNPNYRRQTPPLIMGDGCSRSFEVAINQHTSLDNLSSSLPPQHSNTKGPLASFKHFRRNISKKQNNSSSASSSTSSTSTTDSSQLFTPIYIEDDNENKETEGGNDDKSSQRVAIRSNLFNWCQKKFTISLIVTKKSNECADVPIYKYEGLEEEERAWRFLRNTRVRRESTNENSLNQKVRLNEQIFMKKGSYSPCVMKFHPFDTQMATADRQNLLVWNYKTKIKLNNFLNRNKRNTKIRSLDFLNSHDVSFLLTGSDDGNIRIWKNYDDGGQLDQVSGWSIIPQQQRSSSRKRCLGLVTAWEQKSGSLLASGDVPIVRIWDAQKEMKTMDVLTKSESCVTSIKGNSANQSLFVIGLADGGVKLFDRRLQQSDRCVMELNGHEDWVVNVFLREKADHSIISGSTNGDIKFWEPRMTSCAYHIRKSQNYLSAFDVHNEADLIACGSTNNGVKVLNSHGETMNEIRYHDGIMGQKVGPICCLTFHPHWTYLAFGSTDAVVCAYACQKRDSSDLDDLGIAPY